MNRILGALACAALVLTVPACKGKGGNSVTPVIASTVQVKVTQSGTPVPGVPVTESTGYDSVNNQPTGILGSKTSDSNGLTSFVIGNPNVQYCFSSRYTAAGTTYTPFICQATVTAGSTYNIGT